MRIADIFTGGKYSKALKERDRLADAALGASGYSKSQTEAMRMARELARGRQAQLQGQAMSSNMPLGQRMALAAQNVPTVDAANMFHSLDTAGVKAAENTAMEYGSLSLPNMKTQAFPPVMWTPVPSSLPAKPPEKKMLPQYCKALPILQAILW